MQATREAYIVPLIATLSADIAAYVWTAYFLEYLSNSAFRLINIEL